MSERLRLKIKFGKSETKRIIEIISRKRNKKKIVCTKQTHLRKSWTFVDFRLQN
jgi:hypothetical protein